MKIYGKSGKLSKLVPEYRYRHQQEELSKLINYGIRKNKHVVVEAPTGVGKSISALIGLLNNLKTDGNKRQFLICTATIALQEQYLHKELPLMRKLGYDFSYGLIKGMSNYACPLKITGILSERENSPGAKVLKEWYATTQTGELSEFTPDQLLHLGNMQISAHVDECLHGKCP
jgi:ATP-dependent DNA helicase DinG